MGLIAPFNQPSHLRQPIAACLSCPDKSTQLPTVAVLGAGHGGLALAGHMAQAGAPVHLWNRTLGPLQAVSALGGIRMDGQLAKPARVSASIAQVLDGADVVVVAVAANQIPDSARLCAPHLADGQAVLLVPGRTGGALQFRRELERLGCTARVLLGETLTSPLASRVVGPGMVKLYDVKRRVTVAALPASQTPALLERCLPLMPMLAPAESVLTTSFGHVGAVLHPVVTLLNASRIEDGAESFKLYVEGISPAVARMLADVDAERCAVARAYGVIVPTLLQWLGEISGRTEPDLRRALTRSPVYREVLAPTGLRHRYVEEDVPAGLVPIAELGRLAGVETPSVNVLISLASRLNGSDYRAEGRNLEALGLDGMDPAAIVKYVES
jgi:opine dehydrogenase